MTPVFVITVTDIIWLTTAAIVLLAFAVLSLRDWIRQRLCKHDQGVTETAACYAFCRKCGKNLGFIGAWRKREQAHER